MNVNADMTGMAQNDQLKTYYTMSYHITDPTPKSCVARGGDWRRDATIYRTCGGPKGHFFIFKNAIQFSTKTSRKTSLVTSLQCASIENALLDHRTRRFAQGTSGLTTE